MKNETNTEKERRRKQIQRKKERRKERKKGLFEHKVVLLFVSLSGERRGSLSILSLSRLLSSVYL